MAVIGHTHRNIIILFVITRHEMNLKPVTKSILASVTTFTFVLSLTTSIHNVMGIQQNQVYSFLTKWGSAGTGDGQFNAVNDVHVWKGFVYVPDYNNNRIQKFTSDGKFITAWGTMGTGDGQFKRPAGIAVDSSNNVFVTDRDNSRIEVFTSDGKFITKFGNKGSGNGQIERSEGIDIDPSGIVYISDSVNNNVQKFVPS
ncbi:MAG TPA: 6-bladed beta-propeller [Nitrososphaeraceae archaeon]|nr:6-bladed beta-propeller [Nitrososphaeraceae archaeon]